MAREREKRYVTGYAQPDERGRIIVQLEIHQLAGNVSYTWCEVSQADVEANAAARGATDWTVEDVKVAAGCAGIRM